MRESDITLDWLTARVRENEDGCWIWIMHSAYGKYPQVRINDKAVPVRRTLWKAMREKDIPPTLQIGCKCGTTNCVHPEHLVARTKSTIYKGRKKTPAQKAAISRARRAKSDIPQEVANQVRAMTGTARSIAAAMNLPYHWVVEVRRNRIRVDLKASPWAGLGA